MNSVIEGSSGSRSLSCLALTRAGADAASIEEFLLEAGHQLQSSELKVDRVFVSLQMIHPAFRARTYLWEAPPDTVRTIEWPHGLVNRPGYYDSPDYHVHSTGSELHVQDLRDTGHHSCELYGKLRLAGYTAYLIVPLVFSGGVINTLSIATRRAGGFPAKAVDAFRQLRSAFVTILERFASLETIGTTLNTYLGRDASQKIMRGKIRPGHGELVQGAILFADLDGFTDLSARLQSAETVELLNDYFDCLVDPIEQSGGYVLKFIGDSVLAFFPLPPDSSDRPSPIAAVEGIRSNLAKLNQARAGRSQPPLSHKVCLHFGTVLYGNIGSRTRLDFTIIGEAVNLAARGLNLASTLGVDYLFTEAFVTAFGVTGVKPLGAHVVPGFDEAVALLTLDKEPAEAQRDRR